MLENELRLRLFIKISPVLRISRGQYMLLSLHHLPKICANRWASLNNEGQAKSTGE